MTTTQKPMSISSITSPLNLVMSSPPPSLCTDHPLNRYRNKEEHDPSTYYSTIVGVERSPSHYHHHSSSESSTNGSSGDDENSSHVLTPSGDDTTTTSTTGLLSLQERRQRNKTASAKYRAKKNQQHHDMRSVIHSLTKENDVLIRQLEQIKSENHQLKSTCDKLKSKMMAEKLLQKMLNQRKKKLTEMELDSDEETDTV